MPIQEHARVLANKKEAKETHLITFSAPSLAAALQLGQFVSLQPLAPGSLLNRPMAVYDVSPDTGELTVGVRAIGANTKQYATLAPGDTITLSGPFGSPYDISRILAPVVLLVGGGIGITSLHLFGARLAARAKRIITLMGFQSREYVACSADCRSFGDVRIATDDGSEGHAGYVHHLLKKTLDEIDENPFALICGPVPMMRACSRVCTNTEIPHAVIMEEVMACGFGICASCVCDTADGRVKICQKGPVFDGATIQWNTV